MYVILLWRVAKDSASKDSFDRISKADPNESNADEVICNQGRNRTGMGVKCPSLVRCAAPHRAVTVLQGSLRGAARAGSMASWLTCW